MNRELEIRERVAHYGLELDGHDCGAWDRARNDLEIHAYSDLRHLLDETARLRADLAAMTAERDAAVQDLTHMLSRSSVCVCKDYCKNHKPMCAGWGQCIPEWRGPDAPSKEVQP
jgi:hypothetical protein